MVSPLALIFQIAGWDIGTTYTNVLVGLGIVSIIIVLVYIALYSTEEKT
jgi:hypothetical protein